MKKTKIISLFLSLSSKEKRDLKKIIKGNACKNEYILDLFNNLESLYRNPRYSKEGLEKMSASELGEKVYSKHPIRTNERDKRFNILSKQIIDFLIVRKINTEDSIKEQLLLSIYKERNLENLALQMANNQIEVLERKEGNWSSHEKHEKLAFLKNYIYTYPRTDQNKKRQSILDDIQQHHILAHILTMLKFCCSQLMRAKEYKPIDSACFIKKTFEVIQIYQVKENDLVKLYLQAITTLQEPKDQGYKVFKRMFEDNKAHLSEEIQGDILLYLFTVAYLLSTKSVCNDYYIEACYELLHEGFSKKIFIKNDYLNPDLFINYIVICGEYQQMISNKKNLNDSSKPSLSSIGEVIKEYRTYLLDQNQKLIGYLVDAIADYYDQKYEACLQKINNYLQPKKIKSDKGKLKDDFYIYKREADKLYIRSLRLRAYFEDGDKDMDNHFRAFQIFLDCNRNKFSDVQIFANQNFVEMTKKIMFIQEQKNVYGFDVQQAKEQLKNQLNTCELLVCRSWLRRQLSQL